MCGEHDSGQSRIFQPEMEEITRDWRKLQIEELQSLHSSPNISSGDHKKDEMSRH
jgi:hypothetical protein